MRLERARNRTARDHLHHGGLHLHVVVLDEEAAHVGDDLRALAEHLAGLFGDDQVDVALTVTHLLVAQPVPLLGQGPQALGKLAQGSYAHRQLPGARAEQRPLGAHDVADVVALERGIEPFGQVVPYDIELYARGPVLDMREAGLAHDPARHHAPGDRDLHGIAFECVAVYVRIPIQQLAARFLRIKSFG